MADLGNTSQADTAHQHKLTSWITVGLLVLSSALLGVALIAQSLILAIVGVAVGLAGVVLGFTSRIMDDAV